MKETYVKIKKQVYILRATNILSAVFIVLLLAIAESTESVILPFIMIVLLVLWGTSIVLLPIKSSGYRAMRKYRNDFEYYEQGIDFTAKPDLEESGIYCGDNALFATKEKAIVPYADFSWTYYMETRVHLVIKVRRAVVCFKNGKAIKFKCTQEEFMDFMNKYVIPLDRNVIVGFSRENAKEYRLRYKEWKKTSGK